MNTLIIKKHVLATAHCQWLARLVVLGVLGFLAAWCHAGTAEEFYPLHTGDSFTYTGSVTWEAPTGPLTTRVTWITEVVDSYCRGSNSAAFLHNTPQNTAWYLPETGPADFILYHTGCHYYLISGDGLSSVWNTIKQGKRSNATLTELVRIDAPLFKGLSYGLDGAQSQKNHLDEWYVESQCLLDENEVGNLPSQPRHNKFSLVFRTKKDRTLVEFSPGVGIIRYNYAHLDGSASMDMKLEAIRRQSQAISKPKEKAVKTTR